LAFQKDSARPNKWLFGVKGLILTLILAQEQFNKNMIYYHSQQKGNLTSFCSGYVHHHPHPKDYEM